MNARFLFVATTLTVAGALGSIAGCTVTSTETGNDASPPSSSTSSGATVTDAGDAGDTGKVDSGDCLASKERGPLCEADNTPEPAAKCAKECDVASTAFTSDVALAISDCIDEAIGTDTPTPDACEKAAGPCVAAATAAACENDTTEFCNGVLAKCSDAGSGNVITKADCTQYFKGATTAGKQLLLDCLETEKADPKVCTICMDAIKTVHNGD